MTKKHQAFLLLFLLSLGLLACQPDAPAEMEVTVISQGDMAALGETVYAENCAECHGANLEGEANWQEPNDDGTFRAPPHDASGHTWHHDDKYLWERVKYGTAVLPPNAQSQSDMPAYDGVLTDQEILAVLMYIKSSWPPDIQEAQRQRNTSSN